MTMLTEFRVATFTQGGLQIAFHEPEPFTHVGKPVEATKILDDGHSTSTKRVDGFNKRDGMMHPSLWPGQGGKVLKFDGSLE